MGEPCPPRQQKAKPLTIAIGLLNIKVKNNRKQGIICVAADSQTTRGNVKRSDTQKITKLKFRLSSQHSILAQAGNADNANRAIEILIEFAKSEKFPTTGRWQT
jgi:ATP-dependent protease HslVU (ClpYQ) peptidase subunit